MHRTSLAVLTTLLLGGAALLSCNDRSGPPSEPDRSLAASSAETDIQEVINSIFGKPGGQLTAANSAWKNIQKACPPAPSTTLLDCQTRVLNFVNTINEKLAGGKLKTTPTDPAGGVDIPDNTPDAALLLQLLILQYGGYDIPAGDPEADDLVIVVCFPGTPCQVITPNGHSGVFLPAGACDVPCVIIGQRTDDNVPPLDEFTDLNQFPPFFDWSKQEAGETGGASAGLALAQGDFLVPIEYAQCLVTDGLDQELVDRLRLAHPDGEGGIEIFGAATPDVAPNVPLDCSDVTAGEEFSDGLAPAGRRLQPAGGGKYSGSISQFSPFAGVDPESGTSVTLVVADTELTEGDATTATTTVTPAPPNTEEPSVELVLNGDTENIFEFFLDDGEHVASVDCNSETDSDIDLSTGNHTLQAYYPTVEAPDDSSEVVNITCEEILLEIDGGTEDVFLFDPDDATMVVTITPAPTEEGAQVQFSAIGADSPDLLAGPFDLTGGVFNGTIVCDANDHGGEGTFVLAADSYQVTAEFLGTESSPSGFSNTVNVSCSFLD